MSIHVPISFGLLELGHTPPILRAAHVVFMLGGLAALLICALCAALTLAGRKYLRRTWWFALAGIIGIFIGGIPLGMLTAYYRYGKVWQWDLTDNKTLGILAFWLVYVVLARKTAFSPEPDGAVAKRIALLAVVGVAATVGLYLIPH